MPRWKFLLLRLTRGLWFRSAVLSLIGVAAALLAVLLRPFIPAQLGGQIGAEAVDNILGILASSMLAVTTFSLNIMVGAFSSATTNATPRATRLLVADPVSQNVLATFIGVFLYSIVGIIALSTGSYGEQGRVVLFIVTIAIIIITIVTLLRWIDHLSKLGRLGDTARRVEDMALKVVSDHAGNPFRGCRPLVDFEAENPRAVRVRKIGYIQHIDYGGLQTLAEKHDCEIAILEDTGSFCDPTEPVIRVNMRDSAPDDEEILSRITIGGERTFDDDPRFAVSVLAEIGARALSAAINDIGTAIEIIARATRVMAAASEPAELEPLRYDRLYVPRITAHDLFDDMYTSLGRDGAAQIEVVTRLLKSLATLYNLGGPDFRVAAKRHAGRAAELAERNLALEVDRQVVRDIMANNFKS